MQSMVKIKAMCVTVKHCSVEEDWPSCLASFAPGFGITGWYGGSSRAAHCVPPVPAPDFSWLGWWPRGAAPADRGAVSVHRSNTTGIIRQALAGTAPAPLKTKAIIPLVFMTC